jgi:hypothetical protein
LFVDAHAMDAKKIKNKMGRDLFIKNETLKWLLINDLLNEVS